MGHKIFLIEGVHDIIFCTQCGGTAARRSRKLAKQCKAANAAGRQALKRVEKGWHPWQSKDKYGKGKPRQRVKCVAKYDVWERKWVWKAGCSTRAIGAKANRRFTTQP